jgi:hypothetical protein
MITDWIEERVQHLLTRPGMFVGCDMNSACGMNAVESLISMFMELYQMDLYKLPTSELDAANLNIHHYGVMIKLFPKCRNAGLSFICKTEEEFCKNMKLVWKEFVDQVYKKSYGI